MTVKAISTSILVVILASILNGCAYFTHFADEMELKTNEAVSVDAKQRMIYRVVVTKPAIITPEVIVTVKDSKGMPSKTTMTKATTRKATTWSGFCAEPSPDTVSALAVTLSANLSSSDEKKLGLANAISEGVASIGLRTAAIQTLRDMMYRNCEAYALGAISNIGLETLQRRFQNTMVGILAIEQLTKATQAPPIKITGNASAGGSPEQIENLTNKILEAQKMLEQARENEKNLETEYNSYDVELSELRSKENEYTKEVKMHTEAVKEYTNQVTAAKELPETDSERQKKLEEANGNLTEANKNLTKANNNLKETQKEINSKESDKEKTEEKLTSAKERTKILETKYNLLDGALRKVSALSGTTSTSAQIITIQNNSQLSDTSVQVIADAVSKIAIATIDKDFSEEVCVTLVGQHPTEVAQKGSALYRCVNILDVKILHSITLERLAEQLKAEVAEAEKTADKEADAKVEADKADKTEKAADKTEKAADKEADAKVEVAVAKGKAAKGKAQKATAAEVVAADAKVEADKAQKAAQKAIAAAVVAADVKGKAQKAIVAAAKGKAAKGKAQKATAAAVVAADAKAVAADAKVEADKAQKAAQKAAKTAREAVELTKEKQAKAANLLDFYKTLDRE